MGQYPVKADFWNGGNGLGRPRPGVELHPSHPQFFHFSHEYSTSSKVVSLLPRVFYFFKGCFTSAKGISLLPWGFHFSEGCFTSPNGILLLHQYWRLFHLSQEYCTFPKVTSLLPRVILFRRLLYFSHEYFTSPNDIPLLWMFSHFFHFSEDYFSSPKSISLLRRLFHFFQEFFTSSEILPRPPFSLPRSPLMGYCPVK